MINPYPPAKGEWRRLLPGERRVTRSGRPIALGYHDVYLNMDMSSDLEACAKDRKGTTITTPFRTLKSMAESKKVKFRRISRLEKIYPKIIERVRKHLSKSEEARAYYLAIQTRFRIGGEKDTKAEKKAYGVTTLKPEHIAIMGDLVTFDFGSKSGGHMVKTVVDPFWANLIRERLNREKIFETTEAKVLRYVKSIEGKDARTHDVRAIHATMWARKRIAELIAPKTWKEYKVLRLMIATEVAQDLGNTPSQALISYIDPRVWSQWEANLPPIIKRKSKKRRK